MHDLSFIGLENAPCIAALNSGADANPRFAGTTVTACSEVIEKTQTQNPHIAAIRLCLVAQSALNGFVLKGTDGKYLPKILLDLDYWVFVPR